MSPIPTCTSNLCYFCPLREFSGPPSVRYAHGLREIGTGASSSTRGDFWGPGLQCQGLGDPLLPRDEEETDTLFSDQIPDRVQQTSKGQLPKMAPPLKRERMGQSPRPLP